MKSRDSFFDNLDYVDNKVKSFSIVCFLEDEVGYMPLLETKNNNQLLENSITVVATKFTNLSREHSNFFLNLLTNHQDVVCLN